MVRTGNAYRCSSGWGSYGPRELLSASSGVALSRVSPIRSLDDLRRRFQHAFFGTHGGKATTAWRVDHGIHVDTIKWLRFPHHEPFTESPSPLTCENDVQKTLERYLATAGVDMTVSLNSVHPKARRIHSAVIFVYPETFSFVIDYGYEDDGGWDHELARTTDGETFLMTLNRAVAELDRLCSA